MVGARKFFVAMLVMLLCVCMFAMPVYAAQVAQDGLEVVLSTDKNAYVEGEAVTATLTVTNTSDTDVYNVRLKMRIPQGYEPAAGQSTEMLVDVIEPGEVVTLTVRFTPVQNTATQVPDSSTENETDPESGSEFTDIPQTGDHHALLGVFGLLIASAIGMVMLVTKNRRRSGRFLSLVLCVSLLGTMLANLPVQASASESRPGFIGVDTTITVNDETVRLEAKVEYQPGTEEGLDPALVLEADEIYFVAGEPTSVTFTVSAGLVARDIGLYRNDELIAPMRDDGTGGDAAAGDGVYSCMLTDFAQTAGSDDYHAAVGSISSHPVTLYYFAPLTEETAAQARELYDRVNRGLQEIENTFADASGFVRSEDVAAIMDTVAVYLAQAYERGGIVRYEVGDASAYIKFASGLTMVYEPVMEGTSTGGSDVSLMFAAYQPHPDLEVAAVSNLMEMLAEEYQTGFDSYSGQAVTLDRVKNLGPDQVVFWNGHGGYGPIVKSFLASGEYFDWNAWWWDTTGYYWDCVQDRIINRSTDEQEELACFTTKFISHYCSDLSNDLLFLASCHSGQYSKLANAFLDKGASAVVGFTDTVYTAYCQRIGIQTLGYMTFLNEETGNYYTLEEALERAKDEYGENDNVFAIAHPQVFTNVKDRAAEPVIFGNRGYRYRSAATGTLSGRICNAADRTTPVTTATISIDWMNVTQWTAQPDENGNYSIALPAGDFLVTINAPGYMEFRAYATVTAEGNTYMETFLLVEEAEEETGIAAGTITNAVTGNGIAGVALEIRSGWNNSVNGDVVATSVTDASGCYSIELPLGNYTVYAVKTGFIPTTVNIVVLPDPTGSQNGSMTPVISGTDLRIVLTWGTHPRDLDSHLVGKLSTGSDFHVSYLHKSQYDDAVEICNLDADDTSSYGPETITLKAGSDAPYYYYIHRFAGDGTVGASEARVTVYQGERVVATFNVPTDQGGGDYWNVFAVLDGRLVARNTITASPEISYASSVATN